MRTLTGWPSSDLLFSAADAREKVSNADAIIIIAFIQEDDGKRIMGRSVYSTVSIAFLP
jgi:hypothetical protein